MRTPLILLLLFLAISLPLKPADEVSASGTGFSIDAEGHILTAAMWLPDAVLLPPKSADGSFPPRLFLPTFIWH